MAQRQPISIAAYTATSCLGRGVAAQRAALAAQTSGLARCRFLGVDLDTWVGEAAGLDDPALARPSGSWTAVSITDSTAATTGWH